MKVFFSVFFTLSFGFLYAQINPENVTIARDSNGIAHIFGKTDADAAYGLAWANSEDAFNLMQETLLAGKGMTGRWKGKEGAVVDFLLHSIGAKKLVEEKYESDISADYKKYLEGYCEGLNAYAKVHPKEVLVKKAFPVTPKELLQAYVISLTALSFAHQDIEKVMGGKYDKIDPYVGSNAFAMNSNKTEDGKTYLCINPHWYIDGPLSFYEAHIQSDEGLNFTGAGFQGGTSLFMGNNENLGWGMTYDEWDLTDVYRLKMNPKKKNEYEFDGEYLKLEKRPIWLKVKVARMVIPVKQTTYWSKYGATYKNKDKNYYSVRYGSNMTIKSSEQIFRMNKAKTFDEFYKALQIHALPRFNMVYADKTGNIFYIDNGMVPKRNDDYNWKSILPGNTSKTLWTEFIPITSHPQVKNPKCGYVFNTNNTPFNVTAIGENNDSSDHVRFPKYMGFVKFENNRSHRIMEIIGEKNKFNFENFKAVKFDTKFPKKSLFLESFNGINNINTTENPDIADALNLIKTWNRIADPESEGATFAKAVIQTLFDKKKYGYGEFFSGFEASTELWLQSIRETQAQFIKDFGSIRIKLGDRQKLVRGDKAVPLPGFPDVLSASYTKPYKNGLEKAEITDAYTHFVKFGPNGPELIETMIPYGVSAKPGTKHYDSQMENFSKRKTKKMSLNKEEILKKAEKIYHPGALN